MSIAKTTKQFVEESTIIHGNKYNYSLTNYINAKHNVKIICSVHGEFLQTPSKHLLGRGCQRCGGSKKITFEEFVEKANEIHNYKYKYCKLSYKNTKSKVDIFCKDHGKFTQYTNNHLIGNACKKCANDKLSKQKTSNLNKFIEKSNKKHNNKYNYSKSIYVRSNIKIEISCPVHGSFWQTPNNHLRGSGCDKCGQLLTNYKLNKDNEYFIAKAKEIHKNRYDYSQVNYVNCRTKVKIICNKHGVFLQTPTGHLSGQGCRKCSNTISNLETKWLDSLNIKEENRQISLLGLPKRWKVDGYDPNTNTVYEFNGDFWHGNPDVYDKNDLNIVNKITFGKLYYRTLKKEKILRLKGYNLVSMWENDYK